MSECSSCLKNIEILNKVFGLVWFEMMEFHLIDSRIRSHCELIRHLILVYPIHHVWILTIQNIRYITFGYSPFKISDTTHLNTHFSKYPIHHAWILKWKVVRNYVYSPFKFALNSLPAPPSIPPLLM